MKIIILTYRIWRPKLPLGAVWVATTMQAANDTRDLIVRLSPQYEQDGFDVKEYDVDLVRHLGQEYHIGLPVGDPSDGWEAECKRLRVELHQEKCRRAGELFNTIPGDIRATEEYRVLADFAQKVRVALVPVEELKPL